jgi:NAD(P)-dependent dehydrogenase (short-subunit alcohol dehydrogenase family)
MSGSSGTTLDRLCLAPTELAGQVAVVTGGARGIGRAAALALARLGARVVVADLNEAGGQETVALIQEEGGTGAFVRTDVAREADVARLAMWTLADFGPASILVNNAIISPVASVLETTPDEWDRVIAVNLRGAYLTCRSFLPGMMALHRGTIVNLVSTEAMAQMTAYIASKQGLAGFTQSLAAEVDQEGIRVVAFAPGFVDTPGLREAGERLAPRMGLTTAAFAQLSFHPSYPGMMPAEDAGAATAYLVARLAADYHGEVVTGYTVLERGGFFAAPALPVAAAAEATEAPVARLTTPEALEQATALSRQLAAMIAETEAEFARLPIFVRPLARSGFKARAGQSLQDWARAASSLTAQLDGLAGGGPATGFTSGLPRLLGLVAKLIAYYQAVPGETARFTKDAAVLAEVKATCDGREAALRALVAALKAIRVA